MIDTLTFTFLENKPAPKADNSRVPERSDSDKSTGFSGYMDRSQEKPRDKVENRETTKVEKPDVKNDEDSNVIVEATLEQADEVDADEYVGENTQAVAGAVGEESTEESTVALVSLLLQRTINSNIEDSVDKKSGSESALSAIRSQTNALENLIKKSAEEDLVNQDIFKVQVAGENKEKLSPELMKLMVNGAQEGADLNKLNAQNSRQELLSEMKLKSIDEIIDLNQKDGDLMTKLFDKLDLEKVKGESLFQNRLMMDKALVSSEFNDVNLSKLTTEGVDRNIMANAVNSTDRTNAAAPLQQLKMNTPVTSPEWGTEFGKRIQMLMKNNIQHAEIRMDPPELGRINIKINISQDQANITFTALHANVRDAIESNMNRLRDMLGETGVQLGETDVSEQFQQQTNQSSDDQDQFSFQRAQTGEEDEDVSNTPTVVIQQSIDGVIDYFA